MPEIIVRDEQGRFLQGARSWVSEYPDARMFGAPGAAVRAARATGVLCEVVEDHGLETERVIDTVQG